jgi:predicted enzyme related to lactoylglutathione lyase
MKGDIKSNYQLSEALSALSRAAATYNSASVDHAVGMGVSFHISAGDMGASGTLDVKTQYSDDNVSWTDYPANDGAGNDDAITQVVAAGDAVLHVPNPRGRYSRVVAVVAANAVVFGVTAVLGALRHVDVVDN